MIEVANMTEQDLNAFGFRNAPAGIIVLANRSVIFHGMRTLFKG